VAKATAAIYQLMGIVKQYAWAIAVGCFWAIGYTMLTYIFGFFGMIMSQAFFWF